MAWVRIEDTFTDHPKIVGLSDAAFRLHLHAMCYANRLLTDGFISDAWLKGAAGRRKPKAVAELVESGVWVRDDARLGYVIHDYLAYQPKREEVEAKRAEVSQKRSDAGKRGAESKWQKWQTSSKHDGKTKWQLPETPDGKPMAPSHPIPSPERETKTSDRCPSEGRTLWGQIIKDLDLTERNRREFFEPCEVYSYEPGRLVINARKAFIGNWLNQHFWNRVREAASVIEPGIRVDLITKPLSVRAS